MKDFFSEYGWVIIVGVIIVGVINTVVPDFLSAVSTALLQAITSMAGYLNDLIAAL